MLDYHLKYIVIKLMFQAEGLVHIISNGNRTEWSTNYSVSNSVCDFKSAEHVVQGRFESASTITPELNHTKSCYQ